MTWRHPQRSRFSRLVPAGMAALALLCSSCGLRMTHQEALQAVQGTLPPEAGATAGPGAQDALGPTSSAADPQAPLVQPTEGSAGQPLSGPRPSASAPLQSGAPAPRATAGGTHCTGREPVLKIGSVGQQSGIFAPFLLPGVQAVQAWVASVNAHGGVACHQIQYIVKDDSGDPSTAQSQVQELVEHDQVAAMVYMDAPITGNATVNYLTQRGIPVIGSEGAGDWFYSSPVYRPQATSGNNALSALIAAAAKIGKPKGNKTLGVLSCLEAALCSNLYGQAPQIASQNGLTLAYNAQASLTQPSFTSICQRAQSAEVDLMAVGTDTNSIQRLLRDCKAIGFTPDYITGGPLVAPALMADKNAEGFYVASYTALYNDTGNAQMRAMRAALAQYAPGVPPSIDAAAGWASAQLFQLALEKASSATPAGLLRALGTIKNHDLGGLTQPLTFSTGVKATRKTCFWLGQVHNKTLVSPAGLSAGRICLG